MQSKQLQKILQTSLVIFAMLFGAGNLIFPLKVGLLSGDKTMWGLAGFIATGVLLPLLGLLTIIAFDGDYNTFFGRVGKIPGALLIFFCMMTLGPLIVMPRIIGLSYEMLSPFLPTIPMWLFAAMFLVLVFAVTYKPRRLLDIIGKFLSPLKVASLVLIITIGLLTSGVRVPTSFSDWSLFATGINYGYKTLDLLGTIFFGSIIVKLLSMSSEFKSNIKERIKTAGLAGIGAAMLLALVYIGMGYLAAFHGIGLENVNEGQLFSHITFRILGTYGAALIGFTVFLACFTTTVALTAVVTEYVQTNLLRNTCSYTSVLTSILATTFIPASLGLTAILQFSGPIIEAMYPVIIVVSVCNALYKVCDFKMIKIPVLISFIFVIIKAISSFFIA